MEREEEDLQDLDSNNVAAANAQFGIFSESVRRNIPEANLCSMFCGGRNCKYESPRRWKKELQAIDGLYSSWVTRNILAMSRPNTELIQTYKIIDQFKSAKIKAIVNLQTPGEHSSCGPPLEPSGFTYDPQDFMREKVSFYNFAWKDYGFGSMSNIIDIVRVMQFAISEGKVAVHCHAGLGRTGVLIACYLIYSNRLDANRAIIYIRSKRPGTIQTQSQMKCVQDFASFLQPLRVIFSSVATERPNFTLAQFLTRQKSVLHGWDARRLKHLPKIIAICCEAILDIAERSCTEKEQHQVHLLAPPRSKLLSAPKVVYHDDTDDSSQSVDLLSNRGSTETITESLGFSSVIQHSLSLESFTPIRPVVHHSATSGRLFAFINQEMNDSNGSSESISPSRHDLPVSRSSQNIAFSNLPVKGLKTSENWLRERVALAMGRTEYSSTEQKKIDSYKEQLNGVTGVWSSLRKERDVEVLSGLMWDWMDQLQEPVLRAQDLHVMLKYTGDPLKGMAELERGTNSTVAFLFFAIACLRPMSRPTEMALVQRALSTLTHQNMVLEVDTDDDSALPVTVHRTTRNHGTMRSSIAAKMIKFFVKLLEINEQSLCPCLKSRK